MRVRLVGLLVMLGFALATATTASAGNGGFSPRDPVSPNAHRITDAYWLIFGFAAFVFVLVEGALIWFVIRYRQRGRPRTMEGPQIHGSSRLETMWTVFPVVVLAVIAAFVLYKVPGIKNVPKASAGSSQSVQIRAQQFYWQFTYPDGQTSIDRLVVPVDEVVRLDVSSADVAHSWWIPSLGGKMDAIPGRTNHTWFRSSREGVYTGQCAEFCGLQHAQMTATVEVVSRQAYEEFLAGHRPGSETVAKETVAGVCAKCHGGLAGRGDIGPSLVGNGRFADTAGLVKLLREGQNAMPAVGKLWGDAQMNATVAYLKSTYGAGKAAG